MVRYVSVVVGGVFLVLFMGLLLCLQWGVVGFVFMCGVDEVDEQWVVIVWGGQEFWMCLVGQELWMLVVWQFDYFNQGVVY